MIMKSVNEFIWNSIYVCNCWETNIIQKVSVILYLLYSLCFSALSLLGLPSAPRGLVATPNSLTPGKLLLSWQPPEHTGGRSDITYSVECHRWEGSSHLPCGEKIRYDPANTGLLDTKVSVSELDPYLNYTFTVEVHSGVSMFPSQAMARSFKPQSSAALNTSLHYTGECWWHEAELRCYLCCSNGWCYLWGSDGSAVRMRPGEGSELSILSF